MAYDATTFRGAGTEIIRNGFWNYGSANTTVRDLIIGVQHHIYTVLSITFMNYKAIGSANVGCTVSLLGYELEGGDSQQTIQIFRVPAVDGQGVFVWNDKFSFNGVEPTNFTGAMDGVDDQDAIADQAQDTAQKLRMQKGDAADDWSVSITYIDQNNA